MKYKNSENRHFFAADQDGEYFENFHHKKKL